LISHCRNRNYTGTTGKVILCSLVDTPQQEQELHRSNMRYYTLFLGGYPTAGTRTPLKQQNILLPVPRRNIQRRNRNSTEIKGDINPLFLGGYPTAGTGTPLKQQEILHPVTRWIPHSRNRNSTKTTGDITPCS
jgi:hypothetical protein